jgi:hypothetical protein
VQDDHKIASLDESSSRQIWVGWGSGVVCLALAYLVGGLFFPYALLCFGATMALRGHFPSLFTKHIDAQIIAGTPYQRKESLKAWMIAVSLCLLLALMASSIHRHIAPQQSDLAKTILDGMKRLLESEHRLEPDVKPAPGPLPAPPRPLPERTPLEMSFYLSGQYLGWEVINHTDKVISGALYGFGLGRVHTIKTIGW